MLYACKFADSPGTVAHLPSRLTVYKSPFIHVCVDTQIGTPLHTSMDIQVHLSSYMCTHVISFHTCMPATPFGSRLALFRLRVTRLWLEADVGSRAWPLSRLGSLSCTHSSSVQRPSGTGPDVVARRGAAVPRLRLFGAAPLALVSPILLGACGGVGG